MAASGQEAAAMDSISRVPPSVLQLKSDTDIGEDPGHEDASENVAPAPKRSSNNSKPASSRESVSSQHTAAALQMNSSILYLCTTLNVTQELLGPT